MNEIKRKYNSILAQKFKNLPKILKKHNLNECRDLFEQFRAKLERPGEEKDIDGNATAPD